MLKGGDYPGVESARASVWQALADFYGELPAKKEPPPFSARRVVEELSTERGLVDGYEREVCGSASLINGTPYDSHRVTIPWNALATRDMTTAGAGSSALVWTANQPAADILRPWSVVARAGIAILDNLRENVAIPKVGTAVAGSWLSTEGTSPSAGDPVLAQVTMSPKMFGAHVQFSRRILLQGSAPGVEEFLRQQLMRAAGVAIDVGVLVGGGAPAPTGIMATASIASESGTSFAWTNAANIMSTLGLAGLDDANVAWIAAPDVKKTLGTRVVVSGGHERFIWDEDSIANRPAYVTADMTAGTLLAGDFSRAVLGLWGPGIEVAVNPYSDFPKGILAARVLVACDVCVPQITAFVKSTTIT